MTQRYKGFASDNCSGVHPQVMAALGACNAGYVLSYGDDPYTKRAEEIFAETFGEDSATYFVYNGTGANTLGLGTVLRSYQAIITPAMAHIAVDETGAPEQYIGCKIIGIDCKGGKLTPQHIAPQLEILGVMHHSQPAVISITNPTEVGTIYTLEELTTLCDYAHEHDLLVHMDGARIANAAVTLGCTLRAMTRDCGVDILSFGGTKNGLMFGEAVVFMDKRMGESFPFVRKNGTQLHSKMRYITAQYVEYLGTDLWRQNAEHANRMARRLAKSFEAIDGIDFVYPVEGNGLFVTLSEDVQRRLEAKYEFYSMDVEGGQKAFRFMCSFDTEESEVDKLIQAAHR